VGEHNTQPGLLVMTVEIHSAGKGKCGHLEKTSLALS